MFDFCVRDGKALMHSAGWKFREIRERLALTYREIEDATLKIANAKLNPEYVVTISRLSEIENNNVLPTVYRLYSLCVVYGLNLHEALRWYGVDLQSFRKDSEAFAARRTQLLGDGLYDHQLVEMPMRLDPGFNPQETSYLSRMIQSWGTTPLALLSRLDLRTHRYGYVGTDDWMMYPLITPGALVQINIERRRVEAEGWRNEFERPIYFVETRDAYFCCWLMLLEPGQLLLQPHSLSPCRAALKAVPEEAQIVGQVSGVAMRLATGPAGKVRAPSTPKSGTDHR